MKNIGKKIFFPQVLTSTFPLPTCENLGLYEASGQAPTLKKLTKRSFVTMKFTALGISLLLVIIFNKLKMTTCTRLFHQPSTYNHQEEPGIL